MGITRLFGFVGTAGARLVVAVLAVYAGVVAGAGPGFAQGQGQPVPWGLGFQEPASPVMAEINDLHTMLMWIITIITLFVLALLIIVMVRFNRKANPTPSTNTHNTLLEIAWTVVPILILVVIAVPSFKLLYNQAVTPEADMEIKAIGYQWSWSYEYPEEGLVFDAIIDYEGEPRLLATDEAVVLPVGKVVRVLVTAMDVIHNWAVPALGVKMDAYPGRMNETWLKIDKPGMYYGQCSELCGTGHAFMPIMIKAVSEEEYAAWVEETRERLAQSAPSHPLREAPAAPAAPDVIETADAAADR